MLVDWSRRFGLALAAAATVLLGACGSSSIESQFVPTRLVSFGDALSDLGESGVRYTVNDGSVNVWTARLASRYSLELKRRADGGLSYAMAHARVDATPDALGNAATLSVKQQIDAFLATSSFASGDLVLMSAGTADVIAEMAKYRAGTQSAEAVVAAAGEAGRALGAQVRRMVSAGAKQITVLGMYNLSRTPWATSSGYSDLLSQASQKLNSEFLISVVDLGANVLYIDAALQINLMTANPSAYGFVNAIAPVCTSTDAGVGIGIGAGEVNSALCTLNTLASTADYPYYIFADKVYPTPATAIMLADTAVSRIVSRW